MKLSEKLRKWMSMILGILQMLQARRSGILEIIRWNLRRSRNPRIGTSPTPYPHRGLHINRYWHYPALYPRDAGVCMPSLSRRPRSPERDHRGRGILELRPDSAAFRQKRAKTPMFLPVLCHFLPFSCAFMFFLYLCRLICIVG